MTLLARVAGRLDAAAVPYATIGAAALASAGLARSTFDIDLLVVDEAVLAPGFWTDLESETVAVEIRRGDAEDPLRGVVRLECGADRPVDIVVGRFAWQRRVLERATRVGGHPPVAQPRDLVLLKLYAGGHQDLWDVRELLRISGDALARDVEEDLEHLPASMRERWAIARAR